MFHPAELRQYGQFIPRWSSLLLCLEENRKWVFSGNNQHQDDTGTFMPCGNALSSAQNGLVDGVLGLYFAQKAGFLFFRYLFQ